MDHKGVNRRYLSGTVVILAFLIVLLAVGSQAQESLAPESATLPVPAGSLEDSEPQDCSPGQLWMWQIETVDSAGNVGMYTSQVLDDLSRPHVSYYDWTKGDLKHAYYDGSTWHVETVDDDTDVGAFSSLAAAGNDLHVAYYDAYNDDLKYAYQVGSGGNCGPGGSWQCATVDSTGNVGQYASLDLDSGKHPHIAYHDATNLDLEYAHHDGGTWQLETVDSSNNVGSYASLALDSMDRPHISYYRPSYYNLGYAYHDGSTWYTEVADGMYNYVGQYTFLTLDGADRPHISYYDASNRNNLKYTVFDGVVWQIETVDSEGDVGTYSSLDLDSSGYPHIAYYDATNGDLKYAFDNGCAWYVFTVTDTEDVGLYPSLVLHPSDDRPLISYYDACTDDLKFAWPVPCTALEKVEVSGPLSLMAWDEGSYTATYSPVDPSPPVKLHWDNCTAGATAVYSWTVPGTYTLAVTATNPCAKVTGGISVTVLCAQMAGVQIDGPDRLEEGQTGTYTATYAPSSATPPVTFIWDNGTVGPTASYGWTVSGTYTLAVTGTNYCSTIRETLDVQVGVAHYWIYMPLVMREH